MVCIDYIFFQMEILPWCKGINWRNKFGEFQNEKENLWKRMDYKILVRHEDLENLIRTQTHWVWVWFYFLLLVWATYA